MVSERWARVVLVVVLGLGLSSACGRTPLADGEPIAGGGAKAPRPRAGSGGTSGTSSSGSGGRGGDDAPVAGGGRPVPPPPAGAGAGGATAGTPAGAGGVGGGVAGATGGAGGRGGRGGSPAGAGGVTGSGGRAGGTAGSRPIPPIDDPLNPQRCAVDEPTVLTIDPGGRSGRVTGWLESAPTLMFDSNMLPRFAANGPPMRESDIALWWSIAELFEGKDGGELYFYALSSETQLAVAHNELDASRLMFQSDVVGPLPVGEVVVWHHLPSDRYVAVRIEALYGTEEGARRTECAAVDASWIFAPVGTTKFPFFP